MDLSTYKVYATIAEELKQNDVVYGTEYILFPDYNKNKVLILTREGIEVFSFLSKNEAILKFIEVEGVETLGSLLDVRYIK